MEQPALAAWGVKLRAVGFKPARVELWMANFAKDGREDRENGGGGRFYPAKAENRQPKGAQQCFHALLLFAYLPGLAEDWGILALDIRTPARAHPIWSIPSSESLLLHVDTYGFLARRALLALSSQTVTSNLFNGQVVNTINIYSHWLHYGKQGFVSPFDNKSSWVMAWIFAIYMCLHVD